MQKRFTRLINRLNALGKPISNEIATNKVLRSLNREWQPKVTVIKEANNLLKLDITTLFGKLEEHEQELICLDKHEKKIKKDKEVEKKSIVLVASGSKSSTKEHDENGTNCAQLKKDKSKGQYKKSSKPRRAYIAWENDSESSSERDEAVNFCLMDHHHKKKNVSHFKYEPIVDMSYSELQTAFENLYGEAINAFKRLTSNKRIFSYLEAKVLETEKLMEALKEIMLDASKVDVEEDKSSWFNCETCHIWQKEVITLKSKLNKALEQKVTFVINPSKFKRSLNVSYKKYNFVVECLGFIEIMWFLYSGYLRNMTSDISLFIYFTPKKKGFMTYGEKNKRATLGKDSVGNPSSTTIYDVILVEALKHNLLSISQLCDKGVPSEDILKDTEKEIDQPETVKLEEGEDDNSEKKKDESTTKVDDLPLALRSSKDHPNDNILEDITKGVITCSKLSNFNHHFAFVSQVEPKNAKDALIYEHWLMAMQDDLNWLKRNDVWDLVPPLQDHQIIGTRWVFRNKLDENGVITRNMSQLVAQGYN
ncbi:uncharacterized protein LOC127095777 [Lathyrus oleraceus]|uniref:uncharacterized protein LOC127095777 n=1 Tax=Pisum sativum TaxID=3888 RepID=UPI0021CFCA8B|nr:uncharacterized protein LOC127095777 [Pisum sativum]